MPNHHLPPQQVSATMSNRDRNHNRPPLRLAVPSRIQTTRPSYPSLPYSPSISALTPLPTPSKTRRPFPTTTSSSLSSLFLLLFSLRSLYSLLPFLRSSSPSFSLFPFSFLVSLLSFSLSLFFPKNLPHQPKYSLLTLTQISNPQFRLLISKSLLLALVFLLRFQALRSCGTAATILAEFSGNFAAKSIAVDRKLNNPFDRDGVACKVRGFAALITGLFLLSNGWDRIGCSPLSSPSAAGKGDCFKVLQMLLPFVSGFLGFYEKSGAVWAPLRQLGRKRVRSISLLFTTVALFFPALFSYFVFEEGVGFSVGNLGWPLVNTVVFGVILSENCGEEKLVGREFVVTFFCTLVLELFYVPELSVLGFCFCGFLLWISVRELGSSSSNYPELGSDSAESFSSMIAKPIRHVLSERKSRKIALFLLINTAYMVVEFVAGFMSNSLGLISDACHMLFDCAALAIGLYASYISRLPANNQFNYGRGRFEVLSGYVNAVFLVLVGVLIVVESFERILDPQEISTGSLLTVSVGGLLVNMVGLIFFHEEHHRAHGGSGSCSHSSHSHSHDHGQDHNHHHQLQGHVHDHKHHSEHQQCVSVTHESSHDQLSSSHGHNCHDHDHQSEHHQCVSVAHESSHDKSSAGHGHHCHDHDHHDHNGGDQMAEGLKTSEPHRGLHAHNHHDHNDKDREDHAHHGHGHDHHDDHHCHHHDDNCVHQNFHELKSSHQSISSISHSPPGDSHPKSKESSSSEGKLHEESRKHHHHIDHNMEGIFLHVLADTMGSVGVVISTLLIKYKGWLVADPACSIFISLMIVSSVIPLLRNSAEILLQRVPRTNESDLKVAVEDVMRMKGVHGIQNLHVWSLTNSDVVGTLNLHISAEVDKDSAKDQVSRILNDVGIKDLTLQVEYVRGK